MSERRILENWKAIADYLGHTAQTCRKWEHELGLPIHRLDDSPKAHVFAYSDELDRWNEKKGLPEHGRLSRRLFGTGRKAKFWLIAASAVAVLVVGYLIRPIRFAKRAPVPQAVNSVAVLPFVDLSPARDQEHLGDGIADILINALNGIEGLRTSARTSAFYFKGTKATPREIGERLKADWILEGSVQVQEGKLRVIATLLSAADGDLLWTERYDRDQADIFAVEDEIARRVVDNLKVKIIGDTGGSLIKPGTQNLEAYNLYLTGQYYMRKGWFFYRQAIEFFEKAIDKDPNYAGAYGAVAFCYFKLGNQALARPTEVFPKAKAAALKALEIDRHNTYALGTLGFIKLTYDWDFAGTEEFVRKAIQDNPGSSFLHDLYANLLMAQARFEEGLAETGLALRQDPLSQDLELVGTPANLYFFARKYDLAVEELKKVLERDPQSAMIHIMLVQNYFMMGRYEDARLINQQRREIQGTNSEPDDFEPWNALVYARDGQQARAREILNNLKVWGFHKEEGTGLDKGYHLLAWVYAALGDKDDAFYWLEKAYQERTGKLYLLKVHPLADPLRDDPRFTDLLRRIGLEK
jgi:adenylate cyclase